MSLLSVTSSLKTFWPIFDVPFSVPVRYAARAGLDLRAR